MTAPLLQQSLPSAGGQQYLFLPHSWRANQVPESAVDSQCWRSHSRISIPLTVHANLGTIRPVLILASCAVVESIRLIAQSIWQALVALAKVAASRVRRRRVTTRLILVILGRVAAVGVVACRRRRSGERRYHEPLVHGLDVAWCCS